MVFKKKQRLGKHIMGISDEIDLVPDSFIDEQEKIQKQAVRIVQKFAVGGTSGIKFEHK